VTASKVQVLNRIGRNGRKGGQDDEHGNVGDPAMRDY
jgi:hypothetical protein